MRIRKASKKDIREVAKLMLKEFSKPPFKDKATLNSAIKSVTFYFKIGKAFVVIVDKKIIGAIIFKIEQWWQGPVIIIEDLAVKQEFKKQGFGKNLLDKVEKYAHENKITAIGFTTNKKSPAVEFYKKQGYKIEKNSVSMNKKAKRHDFNQLP